MAEVDQIEEFKRSSILKLEKCITEETVKSVNTGTRLGVKRKPFKAFAKKGKPGSSKSAMYETKLKQELSTKKASIPLTKSTSTN